MNLFTKPASKMKKPEPTTFYQIQIYIKISFKKWFTKTDLWFPCICQHLFGSKVEANLFTPFYLDYLIEQKITTKTFVFKNEEKGEINQDNVHIEIVELDVVTLDRKIDEDEEEGSIENSVKDIAKNLLNKKTERNNE
jgi:hypothetical protein